MNHAQPLLVLTLALCLSACGTPSSVPEAAAPTGPVQKPSEVSSSQSSNGLDAEYFDTIDFRGQSVKRREATVNFAWGTNAPVPEIGSDTFSARYTGELIAPKSGTYRFYLTSDDGSRLSLANQVIISDFTDHAAYTLEGSATLSEGQKIPLTLEYYDNTGAASLKLEWSGPGLPRAVIPTANLSASDAVAPATGQTFYIAPDGNDGNSGSEAQPWLTIHKAVGTLNPGDTVLIKNGSYNGGLYIQRSGLPGKPITYKAFPGASPVVNVNASTSGAFLEGVSSVNIDGLDFSYNFPGAENANGERGEGGIMIQNAPNGTQAHHIGIFNNKVHGFPGGGIGSNLADYITIEGNQVWVNALWSFFDGSGISLFRNVNFDSAPGNHNIIRNNMVFNNENRVVEINQGVITDGNCIIIDDSRNGQHKIGDPLKDKKYTSSTLIENNICAGNGGGGIHVYFSDNVLARHNTLYKNQITSSLDPGELSAVESSNVRFVNNVVYALPGKRANLVIDSSNITFEGNLYFGTDIIPNRSPSDLIADPLFEAPSANLTNANFRLRPGSPAIDQAVGGQSLATDIGGVPRPLGVAADLGAWESR